MRIFTNGYIAKLFGDMINECRKKVYILDKNISILHAHNTGAFEET
jgi:hypothetical protein